MSFAPLRCSASAYTPYTPSASRLAQLAPRPGAAYAAYWNGLLCFGLVFAAALVVPAVAGEGPAPAPAAAHWAFTAPSRPTPPRVGDSGRVRNEVDLFIIARLEEKGLSLSPEASRETLIRRVSFDLTGLPPTPEEIRAFLDDSAPDAYGRMVDRYLDSVQYAERWASHWLDAVGYADSNGYFSADSERPLAYLYRDWVIRSLVDDRPFDRFVAEQVAGDELVGFHPEADIDPGMVGPLTATHYLRNPQDGTGESDGNDVEVLTDRMAVLDGVVQMVGSSLLGLTLQCARCHDHKYDPVTQVEYYRLRAVFAGAYDLERWVKPQDRTVAIGSHAERVENEKRIKAAKKTIEKLGKDLEKRVKPLREALRNDGLLLAPISVPGARRGKAPAVRTRKIEIDDISRRFPRFAAERRRIEAAIAAAEKERPEPLPRISILWEERRDPPEHRLLRAGVVTDPGEPVLPGVPSALSVPNNAYGVDPRLVGARSSGRRLALARWLTSPEHPLLARVAVNRMWQHHFGTGIVATPDNFGSSGSPPSHPELLDWLAAELVDGGWKQKRIHRLIVLSAAYRQSSAPREEAALSDPENRLLARYPLRRLDAESLRDAMLAVSGQLDRASFGPPTPVGIAEGGEVVVADKAPGEFRRSIYLERRRTKFLGLLEVFDAPLMVGTCSRRARSTTPLQSLALLNSPFALARARAFAAGVARDAAADTCGARELGALAFRRALGRDPSADETRAAERFLEEETAARGGGDAGRDRALEGLCQMLLASNAFLYVD